MPFRVHPRLAGRLPLRHDLVMDLAATSSQIGCACAPVVATMLAGGMARLGFPLPAGTNRAGCIDGLPGYLALAVFLGHSLIWINVIRGDGLWRDVGLYPLSGLGATAVPLFFMITGFLFYPRVLRGMAHNNWAGIYISRAFRILPLVSVSVGLVSVIV